MLGLIILKVVRIFDHWMSLKDEPWIWKLSKITISTKNKCLQFTNQMIAFHKMEISLKLQIWHMVGSGYWVEDRGGGRDHVFRANTNNLYRGPCDPSVTFPLLHSSLQKVQHSSRVIDVQEAAGQLLGFARSRFSRQNWWFFYWVHDSSYSETFLRHPETLVQSYHAISGKLPGTIQFLH